MPYILPVIIAVFPPVRGGRRQKVNGTGHIYIMYNASARCVACGIAWPRLVSVAVCGVYSAGWRYIVPVLLAYWLLAHTTALFRGTTTVLPWYGL